MRIPQPGEVLADKYHLEEVLGEGGFGVVLRATTEGTGRPVAVKILKPSQSGYTTTYASRFVREMRTIAKLRSPNTLTLFDAGRTEEGVLFMVCEYVEGEDLHELLNRRGRLEEHEVIWILFQVLQSLDEAHELGVLHRDIKPANIRIFEYDQDPLRVKVLDFGLTKAIKPGTQDRLTATNQAIGTPRYMSLEQLTGAPLTPATDLYAAGLVGAEMLVGRSSQGFREFSPGTRIELTPADQVSDALRDILNRMLKMRPKDRYQSAADVIEDLKPLRRRGPLPAARDLPAEASVEARTTVVAEAAPPPRQPPTPPAESSNRRSRHTWVVLALAAVITVGLGIAWLNTEPRSRQPQPMQRTENPLVRETAPMIEPIETNEPADASATGEHTPPGASAGCLLPQPNRGDGGVVLPADYDHGTPYPAVVWLMADRGIPMRVPQSPPFQRLVHDQGAILIVPEPGAGSSWRPNHVGAVTQHVQRVLESYCIQTDAVFVTSSGGAGSLAAELSCEPWVTAVAVNDARVPASQIRRCSPTIWLSSRDSVFLPVAGGTNCLPLLQDKETVPLHQTEATMQRAYGCDGPEKTEPDSGGFCRTWSCKVPFVSCILDGGIGWPGTMQSANATLGRQFGCDEPPPSDFDATSFVWEFFRRVSTRSADQAP